MNKTQRAILVLGLFCFVLLGLYPPWMERVDIPRYLHIEKAVGYGFIGGAPEPRGLPVRREFISVEVDGTRLATEWVATAVITVGLLLLFQGAKPPKWWTELCQRQDIRRRQESMMGGRWN